MTTQLALLAQSQAGGQMPSAPPQRHTPRLAAHAIVLAWFSAGVLTSGALGIAGHFGLKSLEAGGTPLTWRGLGTTLQSGIQTTLAGAWAKMPTMPLLKPSGEPAPVVTADATPRWDIVRLPVERSAHTATPLGLQVTGTGDQPYELVLDGLPAGARLSRGAPIGPSTWVLRPDDLHDLTLTLDATAPDAFDLKIALVSRNDGATAGSVVQVRQVDGAAAVAQAPIEPTRPGTLEPRPAVADAAARPEAGRDASDSARYPVRRAEPGAPAAVARRAPSAGEPASTAATAPASTATAARTWPEGAYGLGAVSRDPEPQAPSGPPAWSPFQSEAQ